VFLKENFLINNKKILWSNLKPKLKILEHDEREREDF